MFLITHDMEAALICDKSAILRDGKLLEFDSNNNLIASLPSGGLLTRLTIENLNESKIKIIKNFTPVQKTIRVGNEIVEVFIEDFEDNLQKLIQYTVKNNLKVTSMSKDNATFRRYFQIRIQEEQEKERKLRESEQIMEGEA